LRTNRPFDIINTGTGIETRVIDVVEQIAALTHSKSRIQIAGRRRDWDHTVQRCADITAARERLGYTPKVMLSEGLARTVEWMKEREWKA
jgi:nucleoside-diphosphate-sugar epimerase